MNQNELSLLESNVFKAMNEMQVRYQRLEMLADQMIQLQAHGQTIDALVERMQQEREQLQAIEQDSKPNRQAYREAATTASTRVKRLSDQIAETIESLLPKIESLEKSTQQAYQRLAPVIDQSVRGHQMKQAYVSHQ